MMQRTGKILAILLLLLPGWYAGAAQPASLLTTGRLTCEYRQNPLGIDVPNPRFSWVLESDARAQRQSAYELLVSDSGDDIAHMRGNVWQTGKVASSRSIQVAYAGRPLRPFTRYYWRVRVYDGKGRATPWSAPQWFETGAMGAAWPAQWIGDGSRPFERDEDFYGDDPMPLFRKTFRTGKPVATARLYISGLGYYEAYLNGQKVGDHLLDPGWTAYRQQVLYTVYDITDRLAGGVNTAGIMLGNGWYNPLPLRFWGSINMREALATGRPCVKAMIRVVYTDGATETIATDSSWQTAPGPVLRNNLYLGEHYDARREREGWSTAQPATEGWKNAVPVAGPAGRLTPQMQPPVRVTGIVKPVSITEQQPGVFVVDMGQNFAGVARLRVKGPAGTRISIRYGEDRYANGNVNGMTAVAGQIKTGNGGPGAPKIAWQEDSYTLKGGDTETWSPRFTFHGFRYLEVKGWPGRPGPGDIEGLRLSADLQQSGEFTCSNQLFNKLDENIRRTFLSNVFSVQSDCPGREKLGYGGDLLCTTGAFMYCYDMAGFYGKVVQDFVNDQRPQGGITETVPFVGIADAGPGDKSGPMAFQAGFPFLVKKMYEYYGDRRVIADNYGALARLLQFLETATPGYLSDKDLGDHESLEPKSKALAASVFYLVQAQMMAEFAAILGKRQDEAKYARLAAGIRQAVNKKFGAPGTGRYGAGTQSDQLYALWSGLPPEAEQGKVFEALDSAFARRQWHLSTGIFGTKMLFDVLRHWNRNDLAYRIANQRSYPGWGYMIDQGATTLWETWAASDNTYSKNHPMFGSVAEWFYRSLLGINAAAPGFEKIVIKPQPAGDLTFAKGSYRSMYGVIGSNWQVRNGRFMLRVSVPVNTTAEIWLPARRGATIREGGRSLAGVKEVKLLRYEGGYAVLEAGSGSYSFEAL